MSKMYQRYQELKRVNPKNIYLFKSGIFYLFLADDARKMSAALSLKEAYSLIEDFQAQANSIKEELEN